MKRNYGIDLLKMLLMFMVVILHILGHGGVLSSVQMRTANYYVGWMFEIACFCAVNCYALITGYFYYGRKYSIQSLLMICIQTTFYTILIYGLFWLVMPERFSFGHLLNAFFPVFRNTHWYVSSYAGLFVLIPFLNAGISAFSREQAKYFLAVTVLAFTVIPTFFLEDPFKLGNGYTTFWLMYLYMIGAFVKKFNWESKFSAGRSALVFVFSVTLTLLSKIILEELTTLLGLSTGYSGLLVAYNSPTILLSGVALFLCFLNVKPNKGVVNLLRTFSPAAFGVYVIHCHPYVFGLLWERFTFLGSWNPILMPFGVIGFALGIYIPCLLIDYLRMRLFSKLRLGEYMAKLSNHMVPDWVSIT